jgi:hypothetical protein
MSSIDASNNNNHVKDLDDLVPLPYEMRLFILDQHKNSNPNIVLPSQPNIFYATSVKNPTVFLTRPFNISKIYSLFISLCDPTDLVLTIQKSLKEITSINNLTYCDIGKQWKFSYGKPVKYLQSRNQIALYHAAVTAFEKFPPKNIDVSDIIRISEYKTLLGFYEDRVNTRLPYAKFSLTLWYNPEQKNIIMELHKLIGDDYDNTLTANSIKQKLNDDLISRGFEVSRYIKDKQIF